jgi:hypothetical protein
MRAPQGELCLAQPLHPARCSHSIEETFMYYDEDHRVLNFVAGFILGVAIGAGTALLMAPESGRRTRRRLAHAASGAKEVAGERWDELSQEVRSAVDASRKRLKL